AGAALGDGLVANSGTAYVFARSGTTWSGAVRIAASDGAANDQFGNAVALSSDTIVVGAPSADAGAVLDVGAAYVFVRSGATWVQQARLSASDGLANDRFGGSVAIDGSTLVVGASGDDTAAGANAGSIYVFTRSGVAWTEVAHLFPS